MSGKVARKLRIEAVRIAKENGSFEKARKLYRAIKKAYSRKQWL